MIRRYLTPVSIVVGVVLADQVTKAYAEANLKGRTVEVIPGFFGFTFHENPGAAFGNFQNAGPLLGVIAIVVSVLLLWHLRTERPGLERVAFGLVIAGALGNLTDRIVRGEGFLDGKVVDWILLWWIPTFNLADAAVTVAVVLLLIVAWRTGKQSS